MRRDEERIVNAVELDGATSRRFNLMRLPLNPHRVTANALKIVEAPGDARLGFASRGQWCATAAHQTDNRHGGKPYHIASCILVVWSALTLVAARFNLAMTPVTLSRAAGPGIA
jgi:hypothetical protein